MRRVTAKPLTSWAGSGAGSWTYAAPHQYPAGLSLELHELKTRLILEGRKLA